MAAAQYLQWANLVRVPMRDLRTGNTYWVTNLGREQEGALPLAAGGTQTSFGLESNQMYEVNIAAQAGEFWLTDMKLIVPREGREGKPMQWKVEPIEGVLSSYRPQTWNMHTLNQYPKFYEPPQHRSATSSLSVASVVRQKATAGHPIGVRGVAGIKGMVGGGRRTRRRRRSIKRKRKIKRRSRRRKR